MLGKLSMLGCATNSDNSRAGAIALAVGAGGGFWTFFCRLSFLFLSPSLGDGLIWTELLSQRAVKPQNNQPTNYFDFG